MNVYRPCVQKLWELILIPNVWGWHEHVRQHAACASGMLNNLWSLRHPVWMMESAKQGYVTEKIPS